MRLAQERVFQHFESEWRKDARYRIEDLLPLIDEFVRPLNVDPQQPGFIDQILAELIRIEMDLKHAAKLKIDRLDYCQRFPDFVTVIDQSLDRIAAISHEVSCDSKETVAIVIKPAKEESGELEVDPKGKEEIPFKLGPFENVKQIGKGGFGVVCSALDSRDGRYVALKFPRKKVLADTTYLEMFLEEAKRVIKLDHPGIVKTYSVGPIDGYLVIVQQLIEGTDLEKSLNATRTHRQIASLVASIADALAYANQQKIVHRDLKPANIMLDSEGRPYITDFGMALDENDQLAMPNMRCGTSPYMCPQLVAGLTRNLDGRADIWSLGVILYELLAKQRPFRGNNDPEIFEQIETCDPRPLRQIDREIPTELQRICLKCLERAPRYRYLTADELAEDLRYWIADLECGEPTTEESPTNDEVVFVPKGLRSYGADDADFFLQLLPGPRDRDGIPASIRFWSSRICEPVPEENRVPVGVIYGPSGSGKSSFVKAGLLPHLNHKIEAIYVESTQADTEVRLIKALRNRFPEIPDDLSLPEMFRGLSRGEWGTSDIKVLVVFDQFEQRLSQADDYEQSQVAKALRYCDGENLQCLLLIRDDFWLALTRFADALEMDLLEGQNSQAIDLFDRSHARIVLIKLGQAYERLPKEQVDLSGNEIAFLDNAVEQLAVGNFVICVRLTLFAEMFKSQSWNEAELTTIGGARGVGERFLEQTFGKGGASRRHQLQNEQAKAVLEALLPDSGSDIRGSMRRESELLECAKLENHVDKFKDLMMTLDQELRLITRTDPDDSGGLDGAFLTSNAIVSGHYQLTHDYLVPSIRNWLNAESRKTRRGRARARIRELAIEWSQNKRPSSIPSLAEFLILVPFLRFGSFSENEQKFLRQAFVVNWLRLGVWVTVLVAAFATLYFYRSQQQFNLTKSHVDLFMNGRPDAVPISIELLKQNQPTAIQILHELKNETAPKKSSSEMNRINLGLCWLSPGTPGPMQQLLSSVDQLDSGECKNLLLALKLAENSHGILIKEHLQNARDSVSKTRLSILELFLQPETEQSFGFGFTSIPDFRTGMIFELENWHGQDSDFAHVLSSLSDGDAKSGFLIALGRRPKEHFQDSASIMEIAMQVFKNDECPGVHAASAWMLTQWGVILPQVSGDRLGNWYVNSIGETMIRIDASSIIVARDSKNPRMPETEVRITNPFYVGEKEVSSKNYSDFQKDTDYKVKFEKEFDEDNLSMPADLPVTSITLDDAVEFCNWLSAKEGLKSCYQSTNETLESLDPTLDQGLEGKLWKLDSTANGYRLPTYAEWELAASGGANSEYSFGTTRLTDKLTEFAWYSENSFVEGQLKRQRRGLKIPNQFGLFDIAGNVHEICWDSPFQEVALVNSKFRFTRGGSVTSAPQDCMTARFSILPVTNPNSMVGFRLVRSSK